MLEGLGCLWESVRNSGQEERYVLDWLNTLRWQEGPSVNLYCTSYLHTDDDLLV
jgi:hypothetical protein